MKTIPFFEKYELGILQEGEIVNRWQGTKDTIVINREHELGTELHYFTGYPLTSITEEQAREIAPTYRFTSEGVEWEWYGDEEFHVEYALHWVKWKAEQSLKSLGYSGTREPGAKRPEGPEHGFGGKYWPYSWKQFDSLLPLDRIVLIKND